MRVYQGVVDGVDAALIRALVRVAADGAWPDLTFILDLPAEVAVRRASSRVRREAERFETDELAIHELRRQAYLEIARQEPERCVVIDAATSEDDVADAIRRIVDLRLLDRAA
jgi:dTMP kinase